MPFFGSYSGMFLLVIQCIFNLLVFTRCGLVFDEGTQEARKNKYCSQVGRCLPGTHVMCRFGDKKMGPRCDAGKPLSFDKEEVTLTLDFLNEFKRNLAQGYVTNLPRAYGMMKMSWDNTLAEFAQVWANQCNGNSHDQCRDSEEFPRTWQIQSRRFFNLNWSLKDVQFKDNVPRLTMEKRRKAIELLFNGIYQLKPPNLSPREIEQYPGGNNFYLKAIYGPGSNVGCGMSSFIEYRRLADNDPIIYNTLLIVCNFSNEPKVGEKVYETKWVDGANWTPCGCPEGYVEDDCLCVKGYREKSDKPKEVDETKNNVPSDDYRNENIQKDDNSKGKQKTNESNKKQEGDNIKEKQKDENSNEKQKGDNSNDKQKGDKSNVKQDDDNNNDKQKGDNSIQNQNGDSSTEKQEGENSKEKQKGDNSINKQNGDSSTEKQKGDNSNEKQKGDNSNEKQKGDNSNEKPKGDNTIKKQNSDSSTEKPKIGIINAEKKSISNKGTSAEDDLRPPLVILPIFSVEKPDQNRLQMHESKKKSVTVASQRSQRLRQSIKESVQNFRDRYFKDYVVLDTGTRLPNAGSVDEDTFILSKNGLNHTTNTMLKELKNFQSHKKKSNIEIKPRRNFSDLDDLVSEYLVNLHNDEGLNSTNDMSYRPINNMRTIGLQANIKKAKNIRSANLKKGFNDLYDAEQKSKNIASNTNFNKMLNSKAKESIADNFNNLQSSNRKILKGDLINKIDFPGYEIQENTWPKRNQNPINPDKYDTNNFDYNVHIENEQGYRNVDPQSMFVLDEDYDVFGNEEKFLDDEQNAPFAYDASKVAQFYLDRLNAGQGHKLDVSPAHRLDSDSETKYRLDTGTEARHKPDPEIATGYRLKHKRPIYPKRKSSKFQHDHHNARIDEQKEYFFPPDRLVFLPALRNLKKIPGLDVTIIRKKSNTL